MSAGELNAPCFSLPIPHPYVGSDFIAPTCIPLKHGVRNVFQVTFVLEANDGVFPNPITRSPVSLDASVTV